jgi:hypothetical protein
MTFRLAEAFDRSLEAIKWPAAVLSLLSLPVALFAFGKLVLRCFSEPLDLLPLLAGAIVLMLAWRQFRWFAWGASKVIVWEHELTHAIFAWLTGHKVLRQEWLNEDGGKIEFVGRGNWLITVAPYFFPTSAFLLLVPALLMPFNFLPWSQLALGVALGFHLVSTYIETHRDQSDLKKLGWVFCWLFLPTANVIAVALLIAYAQSGLQGVGEYFADGWDWLKWLRSAYLPSLTWLPGSPE